MVVFKKIKKTIHLKNNEAINQEGIKIDMSDEFKDIIRDYIFTNRTFTSTATKTKPVSKIDIKSTEKKIKEMIKDTKGSH